MTHFARALLLSVVLTLPTRTAAAEIVLLGESYMTPVADGLDRLRLAHDSYAIGPLLTMDPASVQVLFVSHDVQDVAGLADWLRQFRAAGGVLFTFYTPAASLAQAQGIALGDYVRDEAGRFSGLRLDGSVPGAPPMVRQRSSNITRAIPLTDSVRVIATWVDAEGRDTGEAALLMGPAGVHMTHVWMGQDTEAAPRLLASLLGAFKPEIWAEAVRGALAQAYAVGGGEAALAAMAPQDKRVRAALEDYRDRLAEARQAAAEGHLAQALERAGAARRAATLAYARAQRGRDGEMRAVWIHNSFGVADWGWDRSMKVLADAGINAIIPNMFDAGQASYPSAYLPPHPGLAEGGDQMALLLEAAHRHGIEVHAWKVNFNLSTAPAAFVERMRREGRLQANAAGETMPWLCPSHPENRRLEVQSMLEVVRNYDVDGIHFDYIRYPGVEGCYDEGCRLRFQAQTGHVVRRWPRDVLTGELAEPFQKWRQEQITAVVREVAVRSRDIRPSVQISAAVFPQWDQSRYTVGQDWVLWAKEGYLDFVCPMDYIPDVEQFATTVRKQVEWVDGRIPVYAGIGAWQMASEDEILDEVALTRSLGADGFVFFEYSADLAERVLPLLREGMTARDTHTAHAGPYVRFGVSGAATPDTWTGTALYPAGSGIKVEAQLVSSVAVPRATGALTIERVGYGAGEGVIANGVVSRAEALRTEQPLRFLHAVLDSPGNYRPVVHGEFHDARGKKHAFTRRGPLVRVRSAAQIDSLAERFAPPVSAGDGVTLAVFADGHGAGSLHETLAALAGVQAFLASRLTDEVLAATDVLVIPQPYNRWVFDRLDRQRLRAWVEAGGGLLVTHDMVGMRGALPIVPEVCARGTGHPQTARWRVVGNHPAVAGVAEGLHPHSYYDHITLEPGPAGRVLAEDEAGAPVLVVGDVGAGRYAALGLIPGLGPDDREVPVAGMEGQLVHALVRWLAAGSDAK